MKKCINNGLLFIILTIICLFPLNIHALINFSNNYIEITNSCDIDNDYISISNVSFVDYSSSSVKAFGLKGNFFNKKDMDINYTVSVNYYNSNYQQIASDNGVKLANNGSSDFILMSNLSILNGHSVSEIKYYRLNIDSISAFNDNYNALSSNNYYKNYSYVIDKYDVDIVVNENNTYDVTETITAYFNSPKHGIYRSIPLKNTVTRLDGTKSVNKAKITNLSVDSQYKTSRENNNLQIKIGSSEYTLTGENTYVIKYNYNIGRDKSINYDELYYNIIGNEWDTVIGNVTFKITMPKEFDSSKIGFSSGGYGSTSNNVIYNVSGNTISGYYDGVLGAGEALTIRCELTEGYFVDTGYKMDLKARLMFIIPFVCLVISILVWYKFCRNDKAIETVEFYPPEGFNSLDIGFLYNGEATNKDVTSLLIYLANKGYIKIIETKTNSYFTKGENFEIVKIKEYDGNDLNEKLFLSGLFKKSVRKRIDDTDNLYEVVGKKQLYNKFYHTMNMILKSVNSKKNKEKIFEKNTHNKKILMIVLIIISIITIITIPTFDYGSTEEVIETLFLALFYMPFYLVGIFAIIPLRIKVFWLVFTIFHSSVFFSTMPIMDAILNEPIFLIGFIFGVICIIGIAVCIKYSKKRTSYGNEILGKIKGFKNFLETVEKDKLETMVFSNPTYFYDILPYTYVLGVSNKWIKKFEDINLEAPKWYIGYNDFTVISFNSFMNSTLKSANSLMSSSPSSSLSGGYSSGSSSSSSGGGSSGGGSGGGGGGSW